MLGGVSPAATVLFPFSEAVAVLDSGFVFRLPLVDAGTEPTSEADAASGSTGSVQGVVSPATLVLLLVSRAAAVLDSVCGFAEAGTEPTLEADAASGFKTLLAVTAGSLFGSGLVLWFRDRSLFLDTVLADSGRVLASG